MKKLLFILLASFFILSCGSRDEEPVTPEVETPQAGTLQAQLLGNWKAFQYVTSYTQNAGYTYSDVGTNNWYFINNGDKSFKLQTKDNYFEGTYIYKEGVSNQYYASFTKVGSEYLEIFVKNIENDVVTFQTQGGAGVNSFQFKARKQP